MKTGFLSLLTIPALLLSAATVVFAQGTAFTYNGRLNDNGGPANGSYDLQFYLRDAATNGNPVGTTNTLNVVGLSNGLFTVTLDFGDGIFTGADRWLEIGVRTNGGGVFTALSPRQKITPTPYTITASNLSGTLPTTQLSGTLASGQFGGAYLSSVTFNNATNSFSGSGAGLTGVNAVTLGGLGVSSFWQLAGNAGTAPGVNFLGTTDNLPLDLKVNGQRAFRLEPTTKGPNVVGGDNANNVASTAGGGTIGGGATNRVLQSFGTVGGGLGNTAGSYAGTVSGGRWNFIWQGTDVSPVASTIAGGSGNQIFAGNGVDGFSDFSTISGGESNLVRFETDHAAIGGGGGNSIGSWSSYCAIGGGFLNSIAAGNGANGAYDTISGGYSNRIIHTYIFAGLRGATVGGGIGNTVLSSFPSIADGATVGGGTGNLVSGRDVTVAGGANNTATNDYATVGGGSANLAGGIGAFIGGGGTDGNNTAGNSALGAASMVGGGIGNIARGNSATIAGGGGNSIDYSGYCTVGGGSGNSILTADSGTIAGGSANSVWRSYGTVGGGANNSVVGGYGIVAGGQANKIIGSDASSIAGGIGNVIVNPETSLATIGGGQSNRIYHGVGVTIAGGQSNESGAGGSTIGGGSLNSIWGSDVPGPRANDSTIGGGSGNFIGGGLFATIAGGYSNRIVHPTQGFAMTIGGGSGNSASASHATIPGGVAATARNYGQMAYASGQFATNGDAQTSVYVCRRTTTNNVETELFLDGASERMRVPLNSTWGVDVLVTGRAANGNSAAYQIRGTIKNNAGATTLVGSPVFQLMGSEVPAWDAFITADNVNDALIVNVIGSAGTSVRWVATVRTVEVSY